MTVHTPVQIGQIWTANGGQAAKAYIAVAVALAESGGNDLAVSPAGDYGLWQINEANFPNLGINQTEAFDPNVSAKVAVRMSGNGTNWAAWCTAWPPPAESCGHGLVVVPAKGSPAYSHLDALGTEPQAAILAVAISHPTSHEDAAKAEWANVQDLFTGYGAGRWESFAQIQAAYKGLMT